MFIFIIFLCIPVFTIGCQCPGRTDCYYYECVNNECIQVFEKSWVSCEDNNICTFNTTCNGNGECTGDEIFCDDRNPCNGEEYCDPNLGCISLGNQCDPDSEYCYAIDERSYICVSLCGNGIIDPGEECDGGQCCEEYCYYKRNGTPCDDDNICTYNDNCNILGSCKGSPIICDDNIPCTYDYCVSNIGCLHKPINESCFSDNNPCNGIEYCHPSRDCISSGSPCCSNTYCSVISPIKYECLSLCGNGIIDLGEQCDGGKCCDNDCMFKKSGTSCSDGIFCNGNERCDSFGKCIEGPIPNCHDGIYCTEDFCNITTDECQSVPINDLCDDNNYCNGKEICILNLGCQYVDIDPCNSLVTKLYCNEEKQDCVKSACGTIYEECVFDEPCCNIELCLYREVGYICSDGIFCNGLEKCNHFGQCCSEELPICDDNNLCTFDYCDGECKHQINNSICMDDKIFCNGVEYCDPKKGCLSSGNPCYFGMVCNEDIKKCVFKNTCGNGYLDDGEDCDFMIDDLCCDTNCSYKAEGTLCSDGLYCNGLEICNNGGICVSEVVPSCDDDIICTEDICDEINRGCLHIPNNDFCNDGLKCNGLEYCDAKNDCQNGISIKCDDKINCTLDECQEPYGDCSHIPEDSFCPDNGNPCDGQEYCLGSYGIGCISEYKTSSQYCSENGYPIGYICNETDGECYKS